MAGVPPNRLAGGWLGLKSWGSCEPVPRRSGDVAFENCYPNSFLSLAETLEASSNFRSVKALMGMLSGCPKRQQTG